MKALPLPWLGVFWRQSYALPGRHAELLHPVCLEGVEDCGKVVVTLSPHPGLVILVTVVLKNVIMSHENHDLAIARSSSSRGDPGLSGI